MAAITPPTSPHQPMIPASRMIPLIIRKRIAPIPNTSNETKGSAITSTKTSKTAQNHIFFSVYLFTRDDILSVSDLLSF